MITAVVLAGGFGTRLRSVVRDVPKPMAPIKGRPFLEHQLDYWIDSGVEKIILSVGYMKEKIINHFKSSYRGIAVEYSEEDSPLGTGGATRKAAQNLRNPFLLINGDTFFPVCLGDLLKFHTEHGSKWTFSLFRADDSNRYKGFTVNQTGELYPFDDGFQSSRAFLANGGVYILDPSVFEQLRLAPEKNISLENEVIPMFLGKGGKIFGIEFDSSFIDIGTPEDYVNVDRFLDENALL